MSNIIFEGKRYKDIDLLAQRVLQATNIYTFRYFPKDRVWMASDVTAEHFGIEKFYKIGPDNRGPAVVYEGDLDKDLQLYRDISSGKKEISSIQVRSRDGRNYYRITLAALEKDSDGLPTVVAGVIEDYDLQMMNSRLMQMLAANYDSVYLVDFEADAVTPLRMNDVISDRYGEKISNRPCYTDIMSRYIEGEVVAEEQEEMRQITSYDSLKEHLSVKNVFTHDFRIARGGGVQYIRMKTVNLSEGSKLTNAIMGFANVSADRQFDMDRAAFFDQITLGCNFSYYSEMLKAEMRTGYIVSMDIRAFKLINDVRGISMGDKTLQYVNGIVERAVDGLGYYGHVNADHFVFFLAVSSEEEVIAVMEQIIAEFEKMVDELDIPKISPYFGVTRWKPGDRIQVMFSEANTAKHRIKPKKGINYGFYREEDTKAAIEEKKIEDSFDGAIKKKEFKIWYQPKFDPLSGRVVGAEALIRWQKTDGTMIYPNRFIPIYEKNGMIKQLDEYVFTSVCRQQKEWMTKFGKMLPISINLSRASLYYENIVDEYSGIAEKIDVDTNYIPIEITESAAVSNSDIKIIADRFFEAGFPLHMDDFGTGYSSLSTLNLLKFDTLKLDKSLIDYIGEFGGDRLIKHTVALAKDLGMKVTAEGVEKEEQVEFLKGIQCDSIQGYYYAKPMPAEEFEKLLETAGL